MGDENYERILDKIAKSANLEREEIERRVEAKRSKLSGLISREGAAQVIAAELGITFDDEKLKIDELLPGMRKVNVTGKIIQLFPIREFTTKRGDPGKVANMILADDTSNVKVVLWDVNHISLLENGTLGVDKVVEIVNGSMRDNEIHLGSFSEFKPSTEVFTEVKKDRVVKEKPIVAFRVGEAVSVRAFVVQGFEPRFFNVCPECKKKVVSGDGGFICAEHKVVEPSKRALMNVVIDDGTENIRAVAFHDQLSGLGLTDLESPEKIIEQRQDLMGKELVFQGNVKMNSYFNNPEFIIESVSVPNIDELVLGMEKS